MSDHDRDDSQSSSAKNFGVLGRDSWGVQPMRLTKHHPWGVHGRHPSQQGKPDNPLGKIDKTATCNHTAKDPVSWPAWPYDKEGDGDEGTQEMEVTQEHENSVERNHESHLTLRCREQGEIGRMGTKMAATILDTMVVQTPDKVETSMQSSCRRCNCCGKLWAFLDLVYFWAWLHLLLCDNEKLQNDQTERLCEASTRPIFFHKFSCFAFGMQCLSTPSLRRAWLSTVWGLCMYGQVWMSFN